MSRKSLMLFAAAPIALAALASPAAAQGIPVHDNLGYLQALATVQNTLKMIDQGRQTIATATNTLKTATNTLQSLQKITNVNQLAPSLIDSATRNLLPKEVRDAATLISGDLSKLGNLGRLASDIQSRFRLPSSSSAGADAAYEQGFKDATTSAATTAAFGENTLNVAQTRMQGLEQLRGALDSAKDPKDVMDLQARVAVEQAQLQNDLLKVQAMQLQDAGTRQMELSAAATVAQQKSNSFYDANIIRK